MSNIRLKRSAVPNRIPTIDQVELGELVINSYDGKLFLKKDIDGQQSIVELGASNGGGGSQGTTGTQGTNGSQGIQGISGGGGGASWGSISGTLNNQTDLSASLGLKAPLDNPIFTGTITAPIITNTSGSNFATISGNVGIGTVSPSAKVHIAGTGYLTQLIQTSTTGSGAILSLSNTTRNYSLGARGDYGTGQFNIVDETAGLVRFSIFSNGNIGVGTVTNDGFKLDVSGSSRFIDVTCTSITETSSKRYKENIYTLNNALDKVISLRGVQYNLKDNEIVEIGVIAEEVANILPEVIKYNNEGQPDSVSYGRLSAVFIEAIKQQQKQIELLKQEINLYIKNKL
jgi:hypothetical protein